MSSSSATREENAAAALNAHEASTSVSANTTQQQQLFQSKRFTIALIVYFALLLDNMLLTVIVPILPDYLANLDRTPNGIHNYALNSSHIGNSPQAQQLAYRHTEHGAPHLIMTKHPIPGKSMVNFTLFQLMNTDDKQPNSYTTFASNANTTVAAPFLSHHSSGSNAAVATQTITATTSIPTPLPTQEQQRDDKLANENGSIGLLLAMKALIQLIFNPIVGNMSGKLGYRLPVVVGTFCLLISSLVFAIGESYLMLLLARAIQGIGSACIGVCGMSLVAQHYPEEARRSKVMGIVLGSIALGVLLGYPFGGILYDLVGKSAPFIILSTIIFLNLGMQLLTMDLSVQPEVPLETQKQRKWRPLLESKMILAIVVAIWFSTSSMAVLEPCLPIWLIQHLQPTKWQLGTVFIPDSVGYFVGTNFFGTIAYKYGQIKVSCISLLLVGIASILIPSATTVVQLLLPHFILGMGIGVIDAALVPLLATYVDATLTQEVCDIQQKETSSSMSSYGTVYAIQQTSVSLAYCLAPLIGGELAQAFGFAWLMRIVGLFNIFYAPMLVYLNQKYDPKNKRTEQNDLLLKSSGRGSQYKQLYNSMDME